MAGTLTLTQTFSGKPFTLETARIRGVDDLLAGPDVFGIARTPGVPDRDFPVAWIKYDAPANETLPAGTAYFATLQSGPEVRQALAEDVADLSRAPSPWTRLVKYLQDLDEAKVAQVLVYTPFGTPQAHGTWQRGPVEERPVPALIANLAAGRPMAAGDLATELGRPAITAKPENGF